MPTREDVSRPRSTENERSRQKMRTALRTVLTVVVPLAGSFARANVTELVSVPNGGTPSAASSFYSSVSGDGLCVAFESFSWNLVANDTNGGADVFVRDRANGATVRVSVATGGGQASGTSRYPSLSADGRFVAFQSDAPDLVVGDSNGLIDVFVHDRLLGTTERVSVSSAGNQAGAACFLPSISGDGRYVSFESFAGNLVPFDSNAKSDIFVRDRLTSTTVRASVISAGGEANNSSHNAVISADGRCVAFESHATNLVGGDTNGSVDVFLRDLQAGTTERVSLTAAGTQANLAGLQPRISGDGRCVSFMSGASNLVAGDTNGWSDVFVRDRQSGTTECVSVSAGGAFGDFHSYESAISGDGRIVAFWSFATNLVPLQSGFFGRVFVHDRQTGTIALASAATDGTPASGGSSNPSLSGDGRYVSFFSEAADLVAGDVNATEDVFLHDRGAGPFSIVCGGDGAGAGCPCGNEGLAGHGCGNSGFAIGGQLLPSGNAGASVATDTLVLTATNLTGPGLFFQSSALVAPLAFGDGLFCAGGTIVRLGVVFPAGGAASFPGGLTPAPIHQIGATASGDVRHYQCWYRDAAAFCASATFNLTNGVSVVWSP
jgi:Tol biopolymer transport system component